MGRNYDPKDQLASVNPRNHFNFFAAESDILGAENEVLFIQFYMFYAE
jgi:hypothetical protein